MTRSLVILACGYRLPLKREYLLEARARSLVWQAVVDESLLNPYTTGTTSFAWLPLEPNYKQLDLLKTAFNLQFQIWRVCFGAPNAHGSADALNEHRDSVDRHICLLYL